MQRSKNIAKNNQRSTSFSLRLRRGRNGATEDYDDYMDAYDDYINQNYYKAAATEAGLVEKFSLDLYDCNYNHENLRKRDLSSVRVNFCSFRYANLEQANFKLSSVELSDFYGANLKKANFSRSQIVYTDLSHANLFQADFTQAKIESCDLSYSNLCGADFTGCELTDVEFFECLFDDNTKLPFSYDEALKKGMRRSETLIHSAS